MNINLPNDEKTEILLLSCIITSINAANYALPLMDESDFFHSKHKHIFAACKSIMAEDKPITPDSVAFELEQKKALDEAGGFAYIFGITQYASIGSPYEAYYDQIKNLSLLRKMLYLSQEIAINSASREAEAEEVIKQMQDKMLAMITHQKIKTHTPPTLLANISDKGNYQQNLEWKLSQVAKGLPPYEGIPSGYPILDHTLGFFKRSCIYYIGARTSMGKTTFLLNLIKNMKKHRIGFFSLEMSASIMIEKLTCLLGNVRYAKYDEGLTNPEECERLLEAAKIVETYQVFVEDPSEIRIDHLVSRAKRMLTNHGIEILFVDYLTRIRASKNHPTKHLQVDEISKTLQTLAKSLEIPIVCFAQLNRAAVGKETPSMVDFRESGSIEEDADACLFIHRPDYYNPNDKPGQVQIIVDKNRIRGIRKTIEFACNSRVSEVYHELPPLDQQMKALNTEIRNPFKDYDEPKPY